MKVALVQIHSVPTEVESNVERGIDFFNEAVSKGADAVVFPELWTCGYYLETFDFLAAIEENDWILEKFRALAKKTETLVILPLPQKIGDDIYIGLYVIEKNGEIIKEYQKSFLWGREQNYFTHGERKYEAFDSSIGRIGVLICYDIEFPEPSRLLALDGAQMIFVPSVWSIPAKNRWDIQLPARALDNTVFLAGINNTGEGACGHCKVISPFGEVLAEAEQDEETIVYCDVDYSEIDRIREKIPYLKEFDKALTPGK